MSDLSDRVAREVMGWKLTADGRWQIGDGYAARFFHTPDFDTDGNEMLLVVKKMQERGYVLSLQTFSNGKSMASLDAPGKPGGGATNYDICEAVCHAALNALEADRG